MIWAMAWRNLWRNRARSIITLSVMVFGLIVCLLTFAVGDGAHQQMVRVATSTYMGHIQLNRRGYHKQQKLHILIPQKSLPVKLLTQAVQDGDKAPLAWQRDIQSWTPRAFGAGLVSTGENSSGGLLLGIALKQESRVTRLPESILKGMAKQAVTTGQYQARFPKAYLDDIRAALAAYKKAHKVDSPAMKKKAMRHALHVATTKLLADRKRYEKVLAGLLHKREVLLGTGLATILKAKVGGSMAVVSQNLYGAPSDNRYTIVGIIESGSTDMDQSLCLMRLADLQELLAIEGQYHSLILRTKHHNGKSILRVASAIAATLREQGFQAQDRAYKEEAPLTQKKPAWEVLPWQRVSPELYEFIRADESGQFVLTLIVFFLAAFVILNTLQMSIMERTREFGVLMSLGMRGSRLVRLVMAEALMLGLYAVALGLLFGLPLMALLQIYGIPLGDEVIQMGGITIELRMMGLITAQGLLFSPAVVLLTTLIVSFIPAYRVSKLKPTQALRHV